MNYFFLIFLISCSHFQPVKEKQKIINQIDQYVEGWNNSDGVSFSKPFSKDARFINIFTMKLDGREAIAKRHQFIFDTFLKGTSFEKSKVDIKFIKDDIAIANVDWKLKNLKCKKNKICPESGVFTQVFQKIKGTWSIIITQNTYKP